MTPYLFAFEFLLDIENFRKLKNRNSWKMKFIKFSIKKGFKKNKKKWKKK